MKINGEDLSNLKEKNSRKALSKTLLKVVIISILIVVISYLVLIFSVSKMKSDYNFNQEILNNGQKYEKSIYIKYKDKIYACVYGLFYQLDNVDIGSFKVLDSMDYSDSCVAVDKNNVYFGNQIVSDLDPNKLYTVGNDYYSDGINSYFCLDTFEKTEDLANKSKIRQYIEYYFFKGEKPQEYSYPFKKVETTRTLKAIEDLRYLASDGEKVYYKGELIKDADLDTLKAVSKYNDDYFYDKNNVYYKTKTLDLSSNENLDLVSVEQGERTYLYDELNGNVSLEEYIFNKKYIPYQVLGIDSGHVKDLVFVSKDGIFFYSPETKEQERVGDNIFKGKITNILSSVISDDKNIYYLHSYDIYRKKRTKYGYRDILVSKNIGIFSLGEKKDWEKIKDIDSGTTGQVWRKGNKYYYFDDLGVDQLIDDVVYEIKDNRTLEKLLDIKYISADEIREFVRDKKLIAFKGEEVTTASIKYKESHKAEIFLAVFLTTFFGIPILIISLKWKAQKKDREKLEEERKKIEKQMEFFNNYYNDSDEAKKEDEKIPTSSKSYDDEEEIKKEIDKVKPIVKNYDDIEGLKKQDKKIDITIKNYNNIERDKKIDSIIKNYNDKKEEK
ncbi:DKNYY domain-containing protein [Fusobacterium animalis]|uniref:DKNYY domain-containing protein n=1 Tax=Fusobacterium animalis TaxID=76859 RepID=UPI001C6DF114|nr:DKNYY domain-containing protein [Fusobacterium animalis]QYR62713.1 DKNYY domain-containing protein [Fusobacterium animalis]